VRPKGKPTPPARGASPGRPPREGPSVTAQETIGEVVRLSVPASLEYVRIVRLTASGVASRLGLDIDEIENLRVAVDELASTVVDAAAPGDLEITFSSGDGELRMEGRAPLAAGGDVGLDQLTAQILNAVCDKYELRVVDGTARFACTRRLPSD
jgi:serine/threonine-protein kinase RsbW